MCGTRGDESSGGCDMQCEYCVEGIICVKLVGTQNRKIVFHARSSGHSVNLFNGSIYPAHF